MSKCICRQIADMVEKKGCDKIHICTGHAGICGYVDVDTTKEMDGILVIRNAKMKPYGNECSSEMVKTAECVGISGLHIVAFNCEDFEEEMN